MSTSSYLCFFFFILATFLTRIAAGSVPDSDCEMTYDEFQLAPWTVSVRRMSLSGKVEYFPATILSRDLLITSFVQFVVAPGPPTWRLCMNANFTVHVQINPAHVLELSVAHVTPHPGIVWKINPDGKSPWWEEEYNLVLIHLRQPLPLHFDSGSHLRSVCLPGASNPTPKPGPGSGILQSGWPSRNETFNPITLNLVFQSEDECLRHWRVITSLPFGDRACGFNTATGTVTNTEMKCIIRGSGSYIRQDNRTVLVGFTNNFLENRATRRCDEGALQYIATLNANDVAWIRRAVTCGAQAHACGDGRCLRLDQICDGRADCADGSDEDEPPNILQRCTPRNCCVRGEELACGVTGVCIQNTSDVGFCNGVQDCPYGEDEDEETCPTGAESGSRLRDALFSVGAAVLLAIFTAAAALFVLLRRRNAVLTQRAVDEFLNGDESLNEDDVRRLKYDTMYEYDAEDCVLERHLGEGRFGAVRLASLKGCGAVAVKTLNSKDSGSVGPSTFIALLAELKTMMYIEKEGGHENVVRFVGACTARIRECELQIAMEYCSNGSLEEFLRVGVQRGGFSHTATRTWSDFMGFVAPGDNTFSAVDLVKWSMQIAQGMTFLSGKRIVHGDLAARNVLLDAGLTAKLCDFGLSHRLFGQSNVYTTTTRLEFPWRWAAPETLESNARVYNLKSDAWSFGMVLWEIFNLGALPWADIADEIALLHLLRLNEAVIPFPIKPQHCASNEIYEIMKSCWRLNPGERPGFESLTEQLRTVYDVMCCTIGDPKPNPNPLTLTECEYRYEPTALPQDGKHGPISTIPSSGYILYNSLITNTEKC